MLWEMLAGRRMWHGMTEVEIVGHLASGPPLPPLPLDSSLPAGLERSATRALDPDPDRRYQTAAELEMELEGRAGRLGRLARAQPRQGGVAGVRGERAERQALIERCVRRTGAARGAGAASVGGR